MYDKKKISVSILLAIPLFILFKENFFGFYVSSISEIILAILLAVLIGFFYRKRINNNKQIFGKVIGILILYWSIELLVAYYYTGQPIWRGVSEYIVGIPFLLYYALRKAFVNSNNIVKVAHYFEYLGFFASIIAILVYFSGGEIGGILFASGYRDGQLFILVSYYLTLYSTILLFDEVFSKKIKIRYVAMFIINVVNIIFIMKFRAQMLGIVFAIVIVSLFQKRIKKIWIFLVSFVILLGLVSQSNIFIFDTINKLVNEIQTQTGTSAIRFEAIKYFVENTHLLFGVGGLLDHRYAANFADFGYYISDVGIFGWYYKYGLIGISIYIYFMFTILKSGIVRKKGEIVDIQPSSLAFLVFLITTSLTLVKLDTHTFYYAIMFSIMESNYYNIMNNEN